MIDEATELIVAVFVRDEHRKVVEDIILGLLNFCQPTEAAGFDQLLAFFVELDGSFLGSFLWWRNWAEDEFRALFLAIFFFGWSSFFWLEERGGRTEDHLRQVCRKQIRVYSFFDAGFDLLGFRACLLS